MSQPKTFLVQILVTVSGDGTFQTTIRSYYDHTIVTGPLAVNVGDRVGFLVQVNLASGRKPLPYAVSFDKETFFGVSSLAVPRGGTSDFLPVLSLKDRVTYTVNITGVGAVDPEIQSGGDNPNPGAADVSHVIVTWDTAANTMSYTMNGVPGVFPIPVKFGDDVQFVAAVYGEPFIANFTITFPDTDNGWQSPFSPDKKNFVAAGSDTFIAPPPVTDREDPGATFPFTASISLDGLATFFPKTDNIAFTM
jgi:hypothetical protein